MARAGKKFPKNDNGATVGYEAQLWQMANALRGSMDAAEYKHVVLGLVFLKDLSDAFEEQHARLEAERARADPEDYARPVLDKRLGRLIDLISNARIGGEEARPKDAFANLPFDIPDGSGKLLADDVRRRHGTSPKGNADFANGGL
jgi:hypothetical protein